MLCVRVNYTIYNTTRQLYSRAPTRQTLYVLYTETHNTHQVSHSHSRCDCMLSRCARNIREWVLNTQQFCVWCAAAAAAAARTLGHAADILWNPTRAFAVRVCLCISLREAKRRRRCCLFCFAGTR